MDNETEKRTSGPYAFEQRWRARLWGDPSSPASRLTAIVAAAAAMLGVAVLYRGPSGPSVFSAFHLSFALALPVLMGILSAVRPGWKFYGLMVLVLLADGYTLVSDVPWLVMQLVLLSLPLLIATLIVVVLLGIKFRFGDFSKAESTNNTFAEGLQFTIRHLLILTTGFAVLIVIAQTFAPLLPSSRFSGQFYFIIAAIAILLSVNALVSVWAILGRRVGLRLVVSLLTAIGLFIVQVQFTKFVGYEVGPYTLGVWICFTALSWAASTLQLYLLRLEGYRFVSHAQS